MKTSNFKFSVSGLKQIMVLVTLCLLSSGFIACSDDEKEEPEVPAEPVPTAAPEPEITAAPDPEPTTAPVPILMIGVIFLLKKETV